MDRQPEFLHVIATRHGIGVFDEEWFAYRQHLLEQLTLASLDAQTVKDFIWLIGIDRDMPTGPRRRLERMVQDRPYIRLLEVELKRDFRQEVAQWISAEAAARSLDWAMSTRLDDDDAVHYELVARLHAEATAFLSRGEQRTAVFAPVIGCNWVPVELTGHRSFHPSPSMGLTLLTVSTDGRSVYHWNHMKLQQELAPEGAFFRSVEDDTMWWLYAHTNLSDQQRQGSDRRDKAYRHPDAFRLDEKTLSKFGISAAGAELLVSTAEPAPVDTTHYLTKRGAEVEKEIDKLRVRLRKSKREGNLVAARRVRREIAELHEARKEMHRRIVEPGG